MDVTYYPSARHSNYEEKVYEAAYRVASWCTDPVCKAHELFRRASIVDVVYPEAYKVETWARKSILYLATIPCAFFSIHSIFGIAIRYIASTLQTRPFLYSQGEAEIKELSDEISLLSWNLCCVPGGYSITDGGVLPWSYRIGPLIGAIEDQKADVVCLYEIFDIQTALCLIEGLKKSYNHFYFNIGPNILGPSSGLFVASKFNVGDPQFTPFPQDALDGRAKFCKKGIFSFDIKNQDERIARIFSTHLQHSEIPDRPTSEEKMARVKEMDLLLGQCEGEGTSVIVTGDFNLDDNELEESEWKGRFNRGHIEREGSTWGGDQFCAGLVGKKASLPSNLDHTMIFINNSESTVSTSFVETGFNGEKFNCTALSDHKGLFSKIKIND